MADFGQTIHCCTQCTLSSSVAVSVWWHWTLGFTPRTKPTEPSNPHPPFTSSITIINAIVNKTCFFYFVFLFLFLLLLSGFNFLTFPVVWHKIEYFRPTNKTMREQKPFFVHSPNILENRKAIYIGHFISNGTNGIQIYSWSICSSFLLFST